MDLVGADATDFNTTLKAAGLDWEPQEDKVGGMDSGIEVPRFKMLYRSDTRDPLGIVGKDYKASSPKEFLESQFEFAEFVKGKVTKAGFLPDRSRAFAFVKLEDIKVKPRAERQVGDICGAYIYSIDGWDGGTPRKSRLYVERLRCKNGMASKEIKSSLWVSHTSGMDALYEKRWKVFMNEIGKEVTDIRTKFQTLVEAPMSQEQMVEFAARLLPGEGTKVENRRAEIVGLFGAGGTGNDGTTRWGAYNAVTEFETHHRSFRTQTGSGRLETTNRLTGVLEYATMAPKALELLLN